MNLLEIKNLNVSAVDKKILNNFNLNIKNKEIVVIMGPNGTGKSTLSKVIMGDNNYNIDSGSIKLNDTEITTMTTDERARAGIFLSFQSPLSIDGVTTAEFIRTAKEAHSGNPVGLYDFIKEIGVNADNLSMKKEMLHRGVNVDFSGGERKKNEILQMNMLKPKLIILDELDSGLDIDNLKLIMSNVVKYYNENESSILIITHNEKILDYITPDAVCVMKNGAIVKTGDVSLAKEIFKNGFSENIMNSEVVL